MARPTISLATPELYRARALAASKKTPEATAAYRRAVAEHLRSEAARLDREAAELHPTT